MSPRVGESRRWPVGEMGTSLFPAFLTLSPPCGLRLTRCPSSVEQVKTLRANRRKSLGREQRPSTLKTMKIELDEDQAALALRAVDHYVAYLGSQKREDRQFAQLRELLGSPSAETRKPPQPQGSAQRTRSRARK